MNVASTKVQRPRPRAGLLMPRPDLEERLVRALTEQRLVLLCAPGGCGKTALLVRSLEQLPPGHGVAWVTLDAGDDLHRLLQCLWLALEPYDLPWRIAPEGLATMAASRDPQQQREAADALVNTLEAGELTHGVIALDDLHHVDDAQTLAFIDRVLAGLGERWTLAITTRQEPALRLARLRATGLLTELRAAELQFSLDEALALLQPAGLDAAAAEALHRRTQGWPAGLRLALGGARGGSGGSSGGGAGGAIDRRAFDFLTAEVLAQTDPALREFLLRTSVLHDLDAVRCTALTGDAQAPARLDALERLDLFVTVINDEPRTLKLHDLFRDALLHRMKVERPAELLALQARAAEHEADPVRRQALLLAAGRPEEAAARLRERSLRQMFEGGVHTVVRLAEQFPPEFARRSADLQDVAGYAKWRLWRNAEAARHLEAAELLHREAGHEAAARLSALRRGAMLAGIGRPAAAREVLAGVGEPGPDEIEARINVRLCELWIALEEGSYRRVAPCLSALLDAIERSHQPEHWAVMVPAPRLTACPGVGPQLLRWADAVSLAEAESPLLLSALAPMTHGWRALWAGRLQEAEHFLARSEGDERWVGHPPVVHSHRLAFTAVVSMALGRCENALVAARAHGHEFPASYGGRGPWYSLNLMGRVAAACGDIALLRDALARLARLDATLPEATPLRLQPVLGLRGHLARLEGRPTEAAALWQQALEHEEPCDLFGFANELRVRLALQALHALPALHGLPALPALHASAAPAVAREPVAAARQPDDERALAEAAAWLQPMLAQPADGPRGALFALPALRELAAVSWGQHLDAAAQATLRAWAAAAGTGSAPDEGAPAHEGASTPPVAPAAGGPSAPGGGLTAREDQVLALMARGLSNKLIARELGLSPHTVKRHVAHVLDKLELASRSQAAAWYHARRQ